MVKVIHLVRAMEYRDAHDEPIVFRQVQNVIGQLPFLAPLVFNFYVLVRALKMVRFWPCGFCNSVSSSLAVSSWEVSWFGVPNENLDLSTCVYVLILFVFESIALFHTNCVKTHLVHLRRGTAFHDVSWFSALQFPRFSSTSEPWTWNVYLTVFMFFFFMSYTYWVDCWFFRTLACVFSL